MMIATAPAAPTATVNLNAPLFIPAHRVHTIPSGNVLIDPEGVNWIAVNRAGYELLAGIHGQTLADLTNGAPAACRITEKFLKTCAKRRFLANFPFEYATYTGRREHLELDRLHEFWITPNYDCNLRCRHCYTIEQVMHNRHQLNVANLAPMIDEAKALGTEIFYLTGGEVMQHPEIFPLIDHITSDRKCILFTNGMLIGPHEAAQLAKCRERLIVQVSIEGHNEEYNAKIRGQGSFAPAVQGIRHLLRAGVRVGVSSTPCAATRESVPKLTEVLCQIDEGGQQVEYHHLIMLLEVGGVKRNAEQTLLTQHQFSDVLHGCNQAAECGKKHCGSRLKIANDKIFHACASNGPRKDFCGAGYTILGVDAEGNLKTCAATINDPKYSLGPLLDDRGHYLPGRLEQLWRHGEKTEWVRNFTLARRPGESAGDLRYFHGGACWYNMTDPEQPFSEARPYAAALEEHTLRAILHEAQRRAPRHIKPEPQLLSYMHQTRIACAGPRKTIDRSPNGLDHGYCICFA